jgi:hypothetical protein
LVLEVFGVADSVFVMAGVPDFAWGLFADGEGVAAFDELDTTSCCLVEGRSDEHVYMVGHYCKRVKLKAALVAISEESCDEEFGVGCFLEMAMLLEG